MSWLFVNTRPPERASILSHALCLAGIKVINMPLLTIESLPIDADDSQKMQRLQSDYYQALIIISPSAARMGLAHYAASYDCDACQPLMPSMPVIAVGEATAQVLRQAGWQVICPEVMSNEGMLNIPVIDSLHTGQRVLIWRGQGGRRLLDNSLTSRQVAVDSIAWYVRRCPDVLAQQYQQFCLQLSQEATYCPVVLISSGEAFKHWQHVVNATKSSDKTTPPQLSDFYYLVLGKRLTEQMRQQHLSHSQLKTLRPSHVLQKLNEMM